MHRSATVVSAFLVCLSAFSQVQQPQPLPPAAAPGRGGRGPAPPPPQLTGEQKSQYQSKIDEIDAAVKDLRARKVNEDLIADVDIYSKAGKWLLEFPQGFANAQNITSFLAVLDQGIERGRQLHEGQSPWVIEKGARFSATTPSSMAPSSRMGVTIPEGYDAGKPDRLYVWLHGRSNTLTEASFINGIKNSPQFPNTAFTADVGQLTLDCYGRGNNANHQAGEVDIFEGIAAMQRRFKDRSRPHPAPRLLPGRRRRLAHRPAVSRSLGRRRNRRRNVSRPPHVCRHAVSRPISTARCTSTRTSSTGR